MASSLLDPSETFHSLFESVGLDVRLRKAVARLGYGRPTLVQSKCLPLTLAAGRDVMVRARTGSGKTLAYCLPLLQKLLLREGKRGVGAIVLVPTRELCTQVHQVLKNLSYYCDDVISLAVLVSPSKGRSDKSKHELERQAAMLRDQPSCIVATPAGLLAHIRSGALELKESVETLVVDEADLVLSFGYSNDIAEIVKALPRICQGFLMSATLSPELDSLKKIVLNTPVVLKLEQESAGDSGAGNLKQFYLAVPQKDKNLVIYVFLKLGILKGKGLFFVNTTDGGYRLKLFLEQFHIRSAVLNAELPGASRMNIIEQFNVGNFDFLIATDESTDAHDADDDSQSDNDDEDDNDNDKAAAERGETKEKKKNKPKKRKAGKHADSEYGVSRGLDFRHVTFVVNVDFPPNARSYAHRVGRTARGGANGVALSLVEKESEEQFETLKEIQEEQPTIALGGASSGKLQGAPEETADDAPVEAGGAAAEQRQPVPLDFDLQEIEGFRYRVEDVSRAVTKIAVREARAAELKAEILNSERLASHFEENPADLQLLRHDKAVTKTHKIQHHLKNVPKYLLPRGMEAQNLNKKRKKKKFNNNREASKNAKDPLRSFDGDVNLDGIEDQEQGDGEVDPLAAEFMDDDDDDDNNGKKKKKQKTEAVPKIYQNTKEGTGKSTSNRRAWKERNKKGEFSERKKSKAANKRPRALGI